MEEFARWFGPCLAAALGFYWFWKERNKESQAEDEVKVTNDEPQEKEKMTNIYEGLNMGQLLERVMKNIGCHINMCKEEPGLFNVTYQGEHFKIYYTEKSSYINIYDVAWYSAKLDDVDNLSIVRQAINACNQQNLSTVLYTIDKENNCLDVHTRQCTILGSYIPDVEDYMRSRLEDSFRQHHNFYRQIEEIRKEQYA